MEEQCVLEDLCLFFVMLEDQGTLHSPVHCILLSPCQLVCRPVTTGGNCKGQGDVFSSRHGTFLCFIIADQTGGPKKVEVFVKGYILCCFI